MIFEVLEHGGWPERGSSWEAEPWEAQGTDAGYKVAVYYLDQRKAEYV